MKKLNYLALSDKQRKFICNGCGPKGGLVPVPNFCFKASCNHHDFNYWLGCNKVDRKKADDQFYQAMKIDCMLESRFLIRLRYKFWAWLYYQAVRLFGHKFFYFADKKRTWEDLDNAMWEALREAQDAQTA